MAWRTAIARDFSKSCLGNPLLVPDFAAVTFRLCLPIFPILGLPFVDWYRAASIYAWLINLGVAEWIVRRSRRDAQARSYNGSDQLISSSTRFVTMLSRT